MQRHVTGIGVKDCDEFPSGFPRLGVLMDELHMEDRRRQIALEHQRADAEHNLEVAQTHRNVDMQRLL